MKKLLEICGIYKMVGISDEVEKKETARVAVHTATIFGPIIMVIWIIISLL